MKCQTRDFILAVFTEIGMIREVFIYWPGGFSNLDKSSTHWEGSSALFMAETCFQLCKKHIYVSSV